MRRRFLAAALASSLAAPAGASAALDASGTREQAAPPGTAAAYVITGRGWGHGVGMSQYGAYGFAQRGYGYQRILAHYYRGTTLGLAPIRRVRVLVADGRAKLTIRSQAPFRVLDADREPHTLAAGSHTFGPGLSLTIDDAPKATRLRGPLVFSAGRAPLELGRRYRGQLEVVVRNGKLRAINVVALEHYLYGVVPSEMPWSWAPEALKAQAVAARSYALSHLQRGQFDLYDDVRSQVYLGIDHEKPTTNAAIDSTAGQVLLYGGKVASTFFFSTSGGRTMSAADAWGSPLPYLVAVPDPYDSISPYHSWGPHRYAPARLARLLKVPGQLLDVQTTRNKSGRAASVVGIGTAGPSAVPAATVRRALGLRSTFFEVGVLSLSPRRTARPLVFGSRTELEGVARRMPSVVLQQRPAAGGGSWKAVTRVVPQPDGTFQVAVKPAASASFRLASGNVTSSAVTVRVAPSVRFSPPTDPTRLSGRVRPLLPGAAVEIQRQKGAAWTRAASATVDEKGNFAADLLLGPGIYRAKVTARGYAPGYSRVLKVVGA